ncbi:aldo/keto reductase [Desertibaculum subflavum]|uniref:aldo/keto reductase n=1 Tax=Desertibaculum subflavum TaxID=2268458 RepID=UPI0034D2825C
MELRPLGRTGIRVSPIGLGTVAWGRDKGLKYERPVTLPSDARIAELIERAEALGINLLDTAPAYGTSESRIGAALAGRRERWVISTKAGERFDGERSSFDFSAAGMRRSVDASLAALRTNRIDIALIHSDGIDEGAAKFGAAAEALARLKQQGQVRAIGFSGKSVEGSLWAATWADVLMVTWNDRERDQAPVIAEAARRGIGVLAKKPLASGRMPASALRLVVETPGVASAILGTTDAAHLADAVATTTHKPAG